MSEDKTGALWHLGDGALRCRAAGPGKTEKRSFETGAATRVLASTEGPLKFL
jgi:hypothetical protein